MMLKEMQNTKLSSSLAILKSANIALDKRSIQLNIFHISIALGKLKYKVYVFLISPWKHMLWVLVRSASMRRF